MDRYRIVNYQVCVYIDDNLLNNTTDYIYNSYNIDKIMIKIDDVKIKKRYSKYLFLYIIQQFHMLML